MTTSTKGVAAPCGCSNSNGVSPPTCTLICAIAPSHSLNNPSELLCTCEVCQAQFLKAILPVLLVVEHQRQSVLVLKEFDSSDDAQLVQRQAAELIGHNQDVACHLPDRLEEIRQTTLFCFSEFTVLLVLLLYLP